MIDTDIITEPKSISLKNWDLLVADSSMKWIEIACDRVTINTQADALGSVCPIRLSKKTMMLRAIRAADAK